jgi:hypothetical protein
MECGAGTQAHRKQGRTRNTEGSEINGLACLTCRTTGSVRPVQVNVTEGVLGRANVSSCPRSGHLSATHSYVIGGQKPSTSEGVEEVPM